MNLFFKGRVFPAIASAANWGESKYWIGGVVVHASGTVTGGGGSFSGSAWITRIIFY